jgi:hypothetical protein
MCTGRWDEAGDLAALSGHQDRQVGVQAVGSGGPRRHQLISGVDQNLGRATNDRDSDGDHSQLPDEKLISESMW